MSASATLASATPNVAQARTTINALWDGEIIDELTRYIGISNKSPLFDPDWAKHGFMDEAVAQFVIAGVLGPQPNAHGPNEFLHIATGKGVALAVASILVDHAAWSVEAAA